MNDSKSFEIAFQITKLITFEIRYNRVGKNKNKNFATSASEFERNKKNYKRGGQCQSKLLTGESLDFYMKWDYLHLNDLTIEEYNSIIEDIEMLKNRYNFIETDSELQFSDIKELSMLPLKV